VLGDVPAVGHQRQAVVVPERQATLQRPRVPARAAEGLCGERRAGAEAAREDDGTVAIDRLGLRCEPLELDVPRALDAPGLPLVGLPDVDELDLVRAQSLGELFGSDLQVGRGEGRAQLPPGLALVLP
jgi:hypothetical protein